jgi:hypothetical protein
VKAHYVIIQSQGQQLPVLFPAESPELAVEAARLGHPVSGGQCDLYHGAWTAAGELKVAGQVLRSRQTHDAELLQRHFGALAELHAGVPFTTRPATDEL